ncbi:disease resistance protein L6-like [Syzygium oleosum]|uniref:disease resistance protein L6-like n=1 Tax=Syzygium oleosum TaxID=219896 RepID=UPI0024B8C929|nr:disease resistance protein L6-like [Syzygium oleosum]
MHRPIFGHSFVVLVAPVLLAVLAFNFLNKKKTSTRRNEEDVDAGASSSMTVPTEINSGGSSSSPTETDNDASSSLTALTGSCYEVFLSFRGPDTRYSFTDHLYNGLHDAGIHAFRDDDELSQGENIRPKLMAAITTSKILIPILSVTYGTSNWCLDELVQIMKRKNNNGQMVLPIFYKVKPADVGHQIGSFGKAFHERKRRLLKRSSFDLTILEKWKQALLEVSNLKGYEANGYEGDLVKSIVRKVLRELKKKFELVISENLVGIDSHVKEITEFVDNKSHATLFVGIHGMGGIGKTTLAKTIYNKLSNQFEHRSFIADVRESWKHNDAHYLQNKLIYDILKQKDAVDNEDEGTWFISSKFKDKKVLILLDDVDNVLQLKCLAGNRDWFSSGSKIIVTTRNERILKEVGVDYAHDHKELDNNQSLILFSKHAFRRESPPRDFEVLTHEVVSISGGLPLSLEVLGSLLCGEKQAFWRGKLDKLKKAPPEKVLEKLMISYQALEDNQQQIFLDIACFFIGTDKRIASYMWEACSFYPEEGIEVLRFMSLIKIGDDHDLRMHDQLRDLGREIVRKENRREPHNRSRLWEYEEVQKVLKENKGTDKIEAIDLSEGNSEGFGKIAERDGDIYTAKQFKKLMSLRFLHMKGAHLSGDFKDLIEELRWLRWPDCPVNFEVKNFPVKELAVLELQKSKINEKWEGWSSFMMAKKLKYLDLRSCDCLENTIFLSAFKHLEVLILNHCRRLKWIDPSIGDMKALLRLDLVGCRSLMELPAELGSLQNLEILDISLTPIEELPKGIGRLRKLRELRAANCYNLKGEMPESMFNLSSLQRLDFIFSEQLQSLPDDLPSSLTNLTITCGSHKLPSLSHLTHLKKLQVWGCEVLECIQVLPSTLVENSECSQPTDIEESKLPQSLNTPFKLEVLDVRSCRSIKIVNVSQFIHLRTLYVVDCENLVEVRGLELDKLIYLERLTVSSCNSIERLLLPKSKNLKKLDARWCKKLAEIQGLDRLEFLESLYILGCNSIERLLLPKSKSLKKLDVRYCGKLAEIQGLDRLEFLESLDISWCDSIERLLLPKSKSLKKLDARECEKLAEIQGLDRLEFLESLYISECASIEKLDLPKSGRLKELDTGMCKKLAEIQGLDTLEFLESLDISKCASIERLDLPKSGRLKILNAVDCINLAEIQGLDRLEFLESLYISKIKSLKTIPELPGTRIYQNYENKQPTFSSKDGSEYTDDSDEEYSGNDPHFLAKVYKAGEDGGVKSGEGFADVGYEGLEGGASSFQLAEAVDSLSW